MDIFPVSLTNDALERGMFVNFDAGVTLSIRECEDKSGFIGKLYDAFTGHLIHNFFGSQPELVCIAANKHVDKFAIYKNLA